jgi:hypothetical protein
MRTDAFEAFAAFAVVAVDLVGTVVPTYLGLAAEASPSPTSPPGSSSSARGCW